MDKQIPHTQDDIDFAMAQAEALRAEMELLGYIASHDVRTPLRAMSNLTKWLKEDIWDLIPRDSQEHLGQLSNRITQLEKLLVDLVTYIRINNHTHEPETIDLPELAKRIVDNHLESQRVTLTLDGPFVPIIGPKAPFHCVLEQLIGNAIKHNKQPRVQIHISQESSPSGHRITISDNGPGIAPDLHEKVFQLFQTLRPRNHLEGTGLGLALVQKIVHFHRGHIFIDDTTETGCSVVLTWPDMPLPAEESRHTATHQENGNVG